MNYEPNTVQWRKGQFVIHDADAKRLDMVMLVIGHTRDGLVKTRYLFEGRPRGVWKNPVAVLHDPARFGIELPVKVG